MNPVSPSWKIISTVDYIRRQSFNYIIIIIPPPPPPPAIPTSSRRVTHLIVMIDAFLTMYIVWLQPTENESLQIPHVWKVWPISTSLMNLWIKWRKFWPPTDISMDWMVGGKARDKLCLLGSLLLPQPRSGLLWPTVMACQTFSVMTSSPLLL